MDRLKRNLVNKPLLSLMIFILVGLGCYLLWSYLPSFPFFSNCDRRNSTMPSFPVFPDSVLKNQSTVTDQSWETAKLFEYVAYNDYETVRSYFADVTEFCTSQFANYQLFCPGEAQPFGKYEVRINDDVQTPEATAYSVYVRWDRCTSETSIRFGED